MQQKGNILIVILVLSGIIIAGAGIFVFTKRSKQPITPATTLATPNEVMKTVKTNEEGVMETVEFEDDGVTLVANLVDISGGNSTGTGYFTRKDGKLTHSVVANLPDPVGNNFYEGWLVQQKPTLKFISTGNMVLGADGSYILEYVTDQEYEGYNSVVITLETVKDITPEEHILEGIAK